MSKIILVTGTSTGLGISIAVQAAQAGHTVYATMRNLQRREALDAAASAAGVSLNVLPLDVSDSASVNAAVAEIIAREGRIDVLVNNAGAGFVRTVEQATEAEIQQVMDVNFTGVARSTKAVMPHMRAARAGHIVTISSVGGLVGQPFNEIYCAAKFAVEGMMEAMASYITPNFGINFTLVEPGGIATEFVANVMKQVEGTGGIPTTSTNRSSKPISEAPRTVAARAPIRPPIRSPKSCSAPSMPTTHPCAPAPPSGPKPSATSKPASTPTATSSQPR